MLISSDKGAFPNNNDNKISAILLSKHLAVFLFAGSNMGTSWLFQLCNFQQYWILTKLHVFYGILNSLCLLHILIHNKHFSPVFCQVDAELVKLIITY